MSLHPYKNQPDTSFWSRSVSSGFNSEEIMNGLPPLFRLQDKVVSAGSCFASNLVPYIEKAGLTYVRTEELPKIFSELGENLGYANFSAAYGNIYTSRQLMQLYLRSLGEFKPVEDRWHVDGFVIDPFRPGLKFPAESDQEFDFLTESHLHATKSAFESADVFVFTLGLTEAWMSKIDKSTYPACPGTISGEFDEKKYQFVNLSVHEVVNDMSTFIEKLRKRNKKVRFVLSVSPVPLVATATQSHVLTASIYSKSVLRVAAEELTKNFKNVYYFPAYEIITGPQASQDFFEPDRRNVSVKGVDTVMKVLLKNSNLISKDNDPAIFDKNMEQRSMQLSKLISGVECDEVMMEN